MVVGRWGQGRAAVVMCKWAGKNELPVALTRTQETEERLGRGDPTQSALRRCSDPAIAAANCRDGGAVGPRRRAHRWCVALHVAMGPALIALHAAMGPADSAERLSMLSSSCPIGSAAQGWLPSQRTSSALLALQT